MNKSDFFCTYVVKSVCLLSRVYVLSFSDRFSLDYIELLSEGFFNAV